ncbi:10095_t:CDS:2 [Funneliformis geosporum]|nr:10095_t:CDS:2 [Funneliformis geosporum]
MSSITLFSLVRGKVPANAFSVKAKHSYCQFPTSERVKFELLKSPELLIEEVLEGVEVENATEKVGKIFNYTIKKKHINVVVEGPATTAKSSQETLELRKELDFLRSLQKGIVCEKKIDPKDLILSCSNDNNEEQNLKPYTEWNPSTVCTTNSYLWYRSKIQKMLSHLIEELKLRRSTIRGESKAYNSKFVLPFLVVAKFEVKKDDFNQGVAQFVVQLRSSIERKREDDEDLIIDKTYGVVTDSTLWYFFECSMEEDKQEYKIHSEEGTIIDWGKI